MRIASIDIGTNTILLLIADIDEDGKLYPLEHQQRFPRLGKEVGKKYVIHSSAFDTVANILNEYKNLSEKYEVDKIVACATSAVRDSSNKLEFISYINKSTGINVEIISGEDEAFLTYKGAISGLSQSISEIAVIDIGGGSTELSFYKDHDFNKYSFQIGAVRITERFFKHNPPTDKEIELAKKKVQIEFGSLKSIFISTYKLIGVAGTITTLACLNQDLMEFDIQKVSQYKLNASSIKIWMRKLLDMTSKQIRAISNTTEGRADILPAGVLILNEFMTMFQFKEIVVSERCLRYGLSLREWEKKR